MPISHSVGPSPIEGIHLAKRVTRPGKDFTFTATSRPGHLLHFVVRGRVEQTSNGRRQLLLPGTVIWYHEDEWVEGRVVRGPWVFYSVNFSAPALSPPAFEDRIVPDRGDLAPFFARMVTAWRGPASAMRAHLCHARLLHLLARLDCHAGAAPSFSTEGKLWWEAESWARRHIDRQVSLADLCAETGRSANTLTRACRAAVGLAPMKRLKQIRLSLARGLVRSSALNMTEIAQRIGYVRVHEFSRDYRKAFGLPPTADRPSGA
jgi:AraC-like DNA-binding protein